MNRTQAVCGVWLLAFGVLQGTPKTFSADTNSENNVAPMSVVRDGIVLHDHATRARFASLFPVDGPVTLHGGTLFLDADVHCSAGFEIATQGVIEGNGHSITLPCRTTPFALPTRAAQLHIHAVEKSNSSQRIGALALHAMPHTHTSVSAQASFENTNAELRVVSEHSQDPAVASLLSGGRIIDWRPGGNDMIVGCMHAEQSLWHAIYNEERHEVSCHAIGSHTGDVSAVAWSPDGTRVCVAVGQENHQIYLYEKTARGTFRLADAYAFDWGTRAPIHSLSWSPDGTSIIAGLGYVRGCKQLAVLTVHDNQMSLTDSKSIAAHISSVSFKPGTNRVFVGLAGATNAPQGHVYTLTDGQLADEEAIDFQGDVYDLAWHSSIPVLCVAIASAEGGEIAFYQEKETTLQRVDTRRFANRMYRAVWADEQTALAALDSQGCLTTIDLAGALSLEDMALLARSPLALRAPLACRGAVLIDGGGMRITSASDAGVLMTPHSSLMIRNAVLASEEPFVCAGSRDAHVVLSDCVIQSDIHAKQHIEIRGNCTLMGTLDAPRITLAPGARLQLMDDAVVKGNLFVAGSVVVQGYSSALDLSEACLTFADQAAITFQSTVVTGLGAQHNQVAVADQEAHALVTCVGGTVVLRDDFVTQGVEVKLKDAAVVLRDQEVRVMNGLYNPDRHTSLWTSASQDAGTTASDDVYDDRGAIVISSPQYQMTHNMALSPNKPIHITTSTVFDGMGNTLSCGYTPDPVIVCRPGVTVTFKNITIDGILPDNIALEHDAQMRLGNKTALFLRGGGVIRRPLYIDGSVSIDAHNALLSFEKDAHVVVSKGASLQLSHALCAGVQKDFFACQDATSQVSLSHVQLLLRDNLTCANGSIRCVSDVTVSGPYSFIWASDGTLSLASDVTLEITDECQLTYQPRSGRVDGIVCDDRSTILLNTATLATTHAALRLMKGRIVCDGKVILQGGGDGIMVGDEKNKAWVDIVPRPGSFVHMVGTVVVANKKNAS